MPEIGPHHPLTYRHEIATPIFDRIRSGGSCIVVGAASMGKSRLLAFLMREDVQQHYLAAEATTTLFAWVDCNRMAAIDEWGLYELILTALVEAVDEESRATLLPLRREAIIEHNALLAQRNVEIALKMLCQEEGLRVVLVLDEFDESYHELLPQTLANLRSLRDMNKYLLTYVLFTRDTLDMLRTPDDAQGFYELLARSTIGLTPYNSADAQRVIEQQSARRRHQLADAPTPYDTHLLHLSGGHPGLIVALLDGLTKSQPEEGDWFAWAAKLPSVEEECRKLWGGLRLQERQTLSHIALGISTRHADRQSLLLKGLICEEDEHQITFFSPLFANYAEVQEPRGEGGLVVDRESGAVWVNGQQTESLTDKEFELVAFLDAHRNDLQSNEAIIAGIYPEEGQFGIDNGTIAALVRRTRKKIEPTPGHPQFLLNVKGRGYRLVGEETAELAAVD